MIMEYDGHDFEIDGYGKRRIKRTAMCLSNSIGDFSTSKKENVSCLRCGSMLAEVRYLAYNTRSILGHMDTGRSSSVMNKSHGSTGKICALNMKAGGLRFSTIFQ